MSTKSPSSRVALTKTFVEKIESPATDQKIYRDKHLLGFALRVLPSGTETFIVERRIQGHVRRFKIGCYGNLTVAQARNRAQQELGTIALGPLTLIKQQSHFLRALDRYDSVGKLEPLMPIGDYHAPITAH